MPEDHPSIGPILCKNRNNIVAEYALRDLGKPIEIARYALAITLPEALEVSLPAVEEVEARTEHNRCVADWSGYGRFG